MTNSRIKEIYNILDGIKINISSTPDFDYIQNSIAKISLFKEHLASILAEILQEKSRVEKTVQEERFEYEVTATHLLLNNNDVKQFSSEKERRNYINFFLLKEKKKSIELLDQSLSDLEKIYGLSRKKSKDLDENYKWLKTQWEIVSSELRFIKSRGSDSEYINKVKESNDNVFEDKTVGEFLQEDSQKESVSRLSEEESNPEVLELSEEDFLKYI